MLTDQLNASLASRTVIDRVLGVVMAQQRCTATEAFDIFGTDRHDLQRVHGQPVAGSHTATASTPPAVTQRKPRRAFGQTLYGSANVTLTMPSTDHLATCRAVTEPSRWTSG